MAKTKDSKNNALTRETEKLKQNTPKNNIDKNEETVSSANILNDE